MSTYKAPIAICFSAFCFFVEASAQQPSLVLSEHTAKLGALSEKTFYFGYASGDKLTMEFSEKNGRSLSDIEIIEYPSVLRFADYKTSEVNKTLDVPATGIYGFRFVNNSLAARICQVRILRTPADQTSTFNSTVYWRESSDTTYVEKIERIAKTSYETLSLTPVAEYYINSGSNAELMGGKSRIIFPVQLPARTREWYIKISSSRNRATIASVKNNFSLLGELSYLIDQTGALGFGMDLLASPPGEDFCDIVLLDYNNARLFEMKQAYSYFAEGSRNNIKSGIIKLQSLVHGDFYIGVRNPDSFHGISVLIEVVAIRETILWEEHTIRLPSIITRMTPYLKN